MFPTCPPKMGLPWQRSLPSNGALDIQQLWASGGRTLKPNLMEFGMQQQVRTAMTDQNIKICKIQYGERSLASQLQQQVSVCIDDVALWMWSNRLQLNTAKTEVLWCSSSRRQHQLPQVALRVGTDYVTPTTSVRDLGIYVDSDVSMRTHVSRTVSSCFATLR